MKIVIRIEEELNKEKLAKNSDWDDDDDVQPCPSQKRKRTIIDSDTDWEEGEVEKFHFPPVLLCASRVRLPSRTSYFEISKRMEFVDKGRCDFPIRAVIACGNKWSELDTSKIKEFFHVLRDAKTVYDKNKDLGCVFHSETVKEVSFKDKYEVIPAKNGYIDLKYTRENGEVFYLKHFAIRDIIYLLRLQMSIDTQRMRVEDKKRRIDK